MHMQDLLIHAHILPTCACAVLNKLIDSSAQRPPLLLPAALERLVGRPATRKQSPPSFGVHLSMYARF